MYVWNRPRGQLDHYIGPNDQLFGLGPVFAPKLVGFGRSYYPIRVEHSPRGCAIAAREHAWYPDINTAF